MGVHRAQTAQIQMKRRNYVYRPYSQLEHKGDYIEYIE